MDEKINRRVRMTKQLLQSSLMEMLETEPIQKIEIKKLCQRADVNRSTFYKYYGSQSDLLYEIEVDTVKQVISILEAHPQKKADALMEICRYLDRNERLVKPLITNDSEFVKMIFSHPTIQKEIERSLTPYYSTAQQSYVFEFIAYGSSRIIHLWINKADRESPEEIAGLLAKLMASSR